MRIRVRNTEVWIPDWERDGQRNLDLPEIEQVAITIDYPTTRSHGRMQSYTPKVSTEQGQSSSEVEVRMDHNRILSECVKSIENLWTVDESGTEVAIRTADQLLNAKQLDDLRDLIAARIVSFRVEDDQEKNS